MSFKIDLDICGESVECEVVVTETDCGDDYMGYSISSISGCDGGYPCLDDLAWYNHVNKLIIDAYLESVGE